MQKLSPALHTYLGLGLVVAVVLLLGTVPAAANPGGTGLVISQVYGGGGNTGAQYTNDFIEIFNPTASAVSVAGWSVQYGSTGGTTWTNQTNLTGSVPARGYYLVQEGSGAGNGVALPAAQATGGIAMAATAGKVALVNSTTALTGTGCPLATSAVDFVGYGPATNCSETTPTPLLSNSTAASRGAGGCSDTDVNSADFTTPAPAPRNSSSPTTTCPSGATTLSINDVSKSEGNAGATTLTFTVSLSATAGASGVTFDIGTADGTAGQPADYTAKTPASQTITAGNTTASFDVLVNGDTSVEADETFFVSVTNVSGATVADGQGQGTILNDDVAACGDPFTPIYTIQGSGSATPSSGTVSTEGVVVGDFAGGGAVSGFYIQDPTGDGNTATSDGIFVFTGTGSTPDVGTRVRVTGLARERFNQTTLNGGPSDGAPVPAANILTCGTGNAITPTDVSLPFATSTTPEQYEGMLVRLPQSLVIAEYFNYARFGEIVLAKPLAGESRPFSGTAVDTPGAAANARTLANSLSRITLDDNQSAQNPPVLRHPNGQPFSLGNRFRGGDLVTNTVGVLGFDFSLYRIYPTAGADYMPVNPRTASPAPVGGTLRVAAMNTLNFFVTQDTTANDSGPGPCGGNANLDCRGADADQPLEFPRQREKLLAALTGLDGDIIGLNELENTPDVEPLQSIVNGLPGYDYVHTGTIGTDAIKVGLIYRPAVVTPVGSFKILTSSVDPRFIDTKSRPTLAQTFQVNATGARFTVAVNHLKSKGSDCNDVGDPDLGDGQGNCSQTRKAAAEALVDWLATDPTASGDPDFLIMGDLNSYAMEQTLTEIKAGHDDTPGTGDDFTNLIVHFQGPFAYSYTFDGQAGSLDHALANASLFGQVTGAEDWHINSDEPNVLDYDTSFKPAEQEELYEPNAYRTSDHDPVVVGLNPNAGPTVDADGPYSVFAGFTVGVTASGSDPNGDILTYTWDLDDNGSFESPGQTATYSAESAMAPGTHTIHVRVTDPGGLSAVDSATVTITVTYDSLCALTKKLVTKAGVEKELCKKLEEAEKAEAKGKTKDHDKKLDEYRKKVEHETGKAISAADAAQLIALSLHL